jgi:hypothetical protein
MCDSYQGIALAMPNPALTGSAFRRRGGGSNSNAAHTDEYRQSALAGNDVRLIGIADGNRHPAPSAYKRFVGGALGVIAKAMT